MSVSSRLHLRNIAFVILMSFIPLSCGNGDTDSGSQQGESGMSYKYIKKAELRKKLTPMQYHVTQEQGTERAFSGEYVNVNEDGVFTCVVCGNEIFRTDEKFTSKSGWPSFYDVAKDGAVTLRVDTTYQMVRTEAICSKCGAHLGHVFEDGPKPTGKRYCINSVSMKFHPEKKATPKSEL